MYSKWSHAPRKEGSALTAKSNSSHKSCCSIESRRNVLSTATLAGSDSAITRVSIPISSCRGGSSSIVAK